MHISGAKSRFERRNTLQRNRPVKMNVSTRLHDPERVDPEGRSFVDREECSERIRLVDEYSQAVTSYNRLLESLKLASSAIRQRRDWDQLEVARLRSDQTWTSLEAHITAHRCLDLHWSGQTASEPPSSGTLLQAAAMAALDVILVANADRRFVDLNAAAAVAFKMPRNEVVGRRVDEFFSEIRGQTVTDAWSGFIAAGVQCGICELVTPDGPRRFAYRAKSNFAPGLQLGVLRSTKRRGFV